MEIYQIILESIILVWCTATFIYSAFKIFKKETPRFFIFLCLADACYIVEELCALIYWQVAPASAQYSFQVSILGTMSVFLFVFTAYFAILDKQIKKEDQSNKIKLISLIAPIVAIATYVICIIICVNKEIATSIIPLSLMMIPIIFSSYFTLKSLLLKNKSEVCKVTFKSNLLVILVSILTLAYLVTYLTSPILVHTLVNLVCGILVGLIPLISIKDNKSWKI